MTDNRATELRGKLDALGIEHLDSDLPNNKQTRWNRGAGGWGACYVEITNNSILPADSIIDNCTLRIYDCTPDQAIAATLGSEREKALEELVRDAYWLIVRAVWTHESQDKFAADWSERVSVLGIEVD